MITTLNNRVTYSRMKIGVLGAGYVGLPLALEMSKRHKVVIFDTDLDRIKKLENNSSYIDDVSSSEIEKALLQGCLVPSNDEKDLYGLDCYFICVPTPLYKESNIPNLSYIVQAAETVANSVTDGAIVILESTSYPGTTEGVVKPVFEKKGLVLDKDYYLAFSPERVDPGNKYYRTANTTKIVGGCTEQSTILATGVFKESLGCDVFTVSSPNVAEMAKILENSYRNVNTGLINEFAMICNHMKIDIWEVIEAAKTKPFGFQAFFPGPGVGGHCIPIDPMYLSYKVKELGLNATLIDTSHRILEYMPSYVVSRIEHIMAKNVHRECKGAYVLVVGVTYKADISDCRESPALKIIDMLLQKGCNVSYYDPHVEKICVGNNEMKSLSDINTDLQLYDLILITTNHSDIDYKAILEKGTMIFDTRNALRGISRENVIRL